MISQKLLIVGAGCAGWTAAIYAARAGLNPVMITGMDPGGQLSLTTQVENYPGFPDSILGPELMNRMQEQAEKFGTQVSNEWIRKVDFENNPLSIETNKSIHYADSVIIATGSSTRKLTIPGEDVLWGHGVSACATCDGPLYRDKDVAVIGGGDTAIEEALFLTNFAKKVSVIHRRQEFKASRIMIESALKNSKIEFILDSVAIEFLGDQHVGLSQVVLQNVETGSKNKLDIDGCFIAIGHVPNTKFIVGQISLNRQGYILTNEFQETNIKGVFAAGDVQDNIWQQAVVAAGSGCVAALAAERYLRNF